MATLRSLSSATPPPARFAPSFSALVIMFVALCAPACSSNGGNIAELCPQTPQRAPDSPAMTAAQFCPLFLQTCDGTKNPPGGYTAEADCERAYSRLTFETTRECRSYHICNSASYDTTNVVVHCRHAVGLDMCADTASGM